MKTQHAYQIAIAACLIDLSNAVTTEIQLTPCGLFKARDGRPHNLAGWLMTADIAALVIAATNNQQDQLLIDYEHQTLNAANNGQPNPAAGWFKNLEWREGLGLFAVGVEWTDKARAAIDAKEYRYISPVFTFDKNTGAVTSLLMCALVNTPALDGMKDLTALATSFFSQEQPMDLTELIKLLGLADGSEMAAVMAAVKELQATASKASGEVEALKAKTPNPAEFVPVSVMTAIQTELAALKADLNIDKVTQLVTVALSDGRLLPAQKDWAVSLGKSNLAALADYLATAPTIAALSRLQSGGIAPVDDKTGLSSAELAVCSAMGLSHEQFIANKELV